MQWSNDKKIQKMDGETLHRNLQNDQHEPHKKRGELMYFR